jgi:micrococcal nuclease
VNLRVVILASLLGFMPAAVPGRDRCVVERIVDGDTFWCRDGRKVRLIGMDSPERGQGESYTLAREALLELIPEGATVLLERDAERFDRYHRWLEWVWADKVLVNERMVADGWAVLLTIPPNIRYVDRLTEAQARARKEKRGLWATDGFGCPPEAFRRKAC